MDVGHLKRGVACWVGGGPLREPLMVIHHPRLAVTQAVLSLTRGGSLKPWRATQHYGNRLVKIPIRKAYCSGHSPLRAPPPPCGRFCHVPPDVTLVHLIGVRVVRVSETFLGVFLEVGVVVPRFLLLVHSPFLGQREHERLGFENWRTHAQRSC